MRSPLGPSTKKSDIGTSAFPLLSTLKKSAGSLLTLGPAPKCRISLCTDWGISRKSPATWMATPVREDRAEAAALERRLSDLVNSAYDLTPEEVDLLWSTAPPRMPRF